MTMHITCPNPGCGKSAAVPDEYLGRGVRCPACGTRFTAEAPAPTTQAADLPRQVGRFVVRSRLGAGAFGVVYRAHDPQLDREVAVKVLRADALGHGTAAERFLREAQVAAGLRHRHIVPVYDTGRDAGRLYIASAFIAGRTLQEVLAAERPSFRQAAEIVCQLARALAHAHAQGVVHRDVKPANVMVDGEGQALLMDFGMARRRDEEARLTREGAVVGTPAYMAPEQAAGGAVGPAADQYALGVVLYELLAGRVPFRGPLPQVLADVIGRDPEPPRARNRRVPRDLQAICLKALAKRPPDRYAECADLADDLGRWLAGEPIRARPPGRARQIVRLGRRHPVLIASAAAAGVLAVAVAVLLWPTAPPPVRLAGPIAPPPPVRKEPARPQPRPPEPPAPPERPLLRYAGVRLNRPKEVIRSVAAHPRQPIVATAAGDVVTIRDLATGKPLEERSFARHRLYVILNLAFTRDGQTLLVGGYGERLVRWDRSTDQEAVFHGAKNVGLWVFSPDGTQALTMPEQELWNLGPIVARKPFRFPWETVYGKSATLAFSPDGTRLALTCSRSPFRYKDTWEHASLWDTTTGKPVVELRGHRNRATSAAFHPKGNVVATGSENIILLHEAATGKPLLTLRGLPSHVSALAFSQDGKMLAAGTWAGTVKVWELPEGAPGEWDAEAAHVRATIPGYNSVRPSVGAFCGPGFKAALGQLGHTAFVVGVAFGSDGESLLSTGEDGTVWLWRPIPAGK